MLKNMSNYNRDLPRIPHSIVGTICAILGGFNMMSHCNLDHLFTGFMRNNWLQIMEKMKIV